MTAFEFIHGLGDVLTQPLEFLCQNLCILKWSACIIQVVPGVWALIYRFEFVRVHYQSTLSLSLFVLVCKYVPQNLSYNPSQFDWHLHLV